MTRPARLALLLIPLIAFLTPVVYASPPDPSWVRGVYDGDDFDDVVVLLASSSGALDSVPSSGIRPPRRCVGSTVPPSERDAPIVASESCPTRGPPAF